MNANQHISEDDLALFALALLPSEAAAEVAEHLARCPVCRDEVGRLQGDLAGLALSVDMQAPPAGARGRLLTAVSREQRFAPQSPAASGVPGRERRASSSGLFGWAGWTGWAIAAALLAVIGWQVHQSGDLRQQVAVQRAALDKADAAAQATGTLAQQEATAASHEQAELARTQRELARAREVLDTLNDPAAMQVSLQLTAAASAKPQGHASYNAKKGSLVFIATHLTPVAPGKTYELWLLPASGSAPIGAGLFRPDRNGNASVVLPALPKNVAAKGFGVTVEPDGGSPSPTPPIVLSGT